MGATARPPGASPCSQASRRASPCGRRTKGSCSCRRSARASSLAGMVSGVAGRAPPPHGVRPGPLSDAARGGELQAPPSRRETICWRHSASSEPSTGSPTRGAITCRAGVHRPHRRLRVQRLRQRDLAAPRPTCWPWASAAGRSTASGRGWPPSRSRLCSPATYVVFVAMAYDLPRLLTARSTGCCCSSGRARCSCSSWRFARRKKPASLSGARSRAKPRACRRDHPQTRAPPMVLLPLLAGWLLYRMYRYAYGPAGRVPAERRALGGDPARDDRAPVPGAPAYPDRSGRGLGAGLGRPRPAALASAGPPHSAGRGGTGHLGDRASGRHYPGWTLVIGLVAAPNSTGRPDLSPVPGSISGFSGGASSPTRPAPPDSSSCHRGREFAILHVRLLSGGSDRFSALVPWIGLRGLPYHGLRDRPPARGRT